MTFSHAYNNKILTVDVDSLKSILHYTNRAQVIGALQYYNLQLVDNVQVKFEKQRFDVAKTTVSTTYLYFYLIISHLDDFMTVCRLFVFCVSQSRF
jgi:hypothetical protein